MNLGFVGDIVVDAFDFVGDALEWAGEKVSDAWDSDIGRLAIIAAAGYAVSEMMAANQLAAETALTPTIAAEGTGVLATGAETLAVSEAGAIGAEVGAFDATLAEASALDAGAIDLTLAGGAESGALAGMETAAGIPPPPVTPIDPMLKYGGMMAGGQMVSGYMGGKAQEEAEARRREEEAAARDRQNVWGVNYAEGGQATGISAGDRLKQLNRQYFDSAAPVAQGQDQYALRGDREKQGALNELTSIARPADQYGHRT